MNAVWALLTAGLLAAIAAAVALATSPQERAPSAARPQPLLAADAARWPRLVGIASDPWHLDEWERAVGARLDVVMLFRAGSRRTDLRPFFREATRRGAVPMISWEPWRPKHGDEPGKIQPAYANRAIAAGAQDAYVRSVARAVASVRGPVVIRHAHEMTGYWYPWHHDPDAYVAAWRRIVSLFHAEGARNAVFVWSVNANLYQGTATWKRLIDAYWPGADYVDAVGLTTMRSARKPFTVTQFGRRLSELRAYGRPIWMTEAGATSHRPQFLADLHSFLVSNEWVRTVIWSQPSSVAAKGSVTAVGLGRIARHFHALRAR